MQIVEPIQTIKAYILVDSVQCLHHQSWNLDDKDIDESVKKYLMDSLPPNVAESFDSHMIESLTRDTSEVASQAGSILSEDSLIDLNFLFENEESIPVDTSNNAKIRK